MGKKKADVIIIMCLPLHLVDIGSRERRLFASLLLILPCFVIHIYAFRLACGPIIFVLGEGSGEGLRRQPGNPFLILSPFYRDNPMHNLVR